MKLKPDNPITYDDIIRRLFHLNKYQYKKWTELDDKKLKKLIHQMLEKMLKVNN